jgi:hypothetical protein
MNEKNKLFLKIGVFLFLLFWLAFLVSQKIDFASGDLGRHIKNGEWVVEHHFDLRSQDSPVHENFYSYTNPDFSTINHHWGAGVIFFEIFKFVGFSGLSVFYTSLVVLAFLFFFLVAKRESNFTIAAMLSLFLIPLIAERREVRPEVFSYVFAGMFFWALWAWKKKELAMSRLYIFPVLMIFWVNLHVYFFLGLFLMGVFWISDIFRLIFSRLSDQGFQETLFRVKNLTIVSILSALAALINPFGWKGLVYPLEIFRNYGYTIVENKSVSFVESYGIVNPNYLLIKLVLIALAFGILLAFFINPKKFSPENLMFALFFGITGWVAIRNFSLLGFFALPILAANLNGIFSPNKKENLPAKENGLAMVYIVVCILAVFCNWQFISAHSTTAGTGLQAGEMGAADFLKSEKVSGPIFNDYDIGGYLIFSLPKEEKVFVDNRPEAYPDSFFSQVYKPMQENTDIFSAIDEEYHFNVIVFYRNDITPWAQAFFGSIAKNEEWIPVFRDDCAIIYLKNNEGNKAIIEKYKI